MLNFYTCTLYIYVTFSSVQFSSVAQSCPTLWPHESQHTRPPCPSPTPGVHPNSHPLSRWWHPAISSCRPFLLLPPIPPSIRIFSSESTLHMRWPKYWSGLPFPSPGDLPDPEIDPGSPVLPADSLPSEPPEKPHDKPRQHIRKQRHHLLTKICIVKAMVFPVVIYGWERP